MNESDNVQNSNAIEWEYKMPLLTNPFFLADFAKVSLISAAICAVLVLIMGIFSGSMDIEEALTAAGFVAVVGFVTLVVLIVFVCLVIYQNKFYTAFKLDENGAQAEVSIGQRRINKLVVILGILAGRPGAAGAGFLAQSQESMWMPWEDVYQIDYYPSRRVISLKNSWRTVFRLYCTNANYDIVADLCRRNYDASADKRASNTRASQKAKSEYAALFKSSILWIILGTVSAVMLSASPVLDAQDYIWGAYGFLLLGCLVAGSVRRFLGICALVGLAAILAVMIDESLKTVTLDIFGLAKYTAAELAMKHHPVESVLSYIGMLGLIITGMRNVLANPLGKGWDSSTTRKTLPAAIALLVLIGAGSGIAHWMRATAVHQTPPQLQLAEFEPWDTSQIIEFKKDYNNMLEALRACQHASSTSSEQATTQYNSSRKKYLATLNRVKRSGNDAEKMLVDSLDSAYNAWLLYTKKPHSSVSTGNDPAFR